MNPFFGNNGYGYNRPNLGESLKRFLAQKSALNYLLMANVGVWIMVAMVNLVLWLFKNQGMNVLVQFMALPSDVSAWLMKPWTVVSYMFLHERFWHLFFNLWMLYFGGMIFMRFLSERKMVWTYLLGGLSGALFFMLAYNIFPVFEDVRHGAYIMGASASVLAILVAAASYKPDFELNLMLFGTMKFKWLAVVFVVIDLLSISADNPGGHISHLGGAFYGFLFGFLMRKDFSLAGLFHLPKRSRLKYTRYKTVKEKPQRPVSDEDYNQHKAERERDVDAILDKVAKSGYESLTKEEKDFLFRSSR